MTCACCPAEIATPAGWVEVKEWLGNGMVLVNKPVCVRCKALIVVTGMGGIIKQETVTRQEPTTKVEGLEQPIT